MPIRTNYKYPLDILGTNPDNRMLGEKHTIGTTRGRIFIADAGPFFGHTAVVRDATNGQVLEPHNDYVLIHSVREAQEITANPVYCGVRILNPDVSTEIEIDVSYVGGEFSYMTGTLMAMLVDLLNDDREIDWGGLIGVPSEFVPAPHLHSAYDLYAMKHIVAAQWDTADAIREGHKPSHDLLFQMINGRIEVFETVVPELIDCYIEGEQLLATLL